MHSLRLACPLGQLRVSWSGLWRAVAPAEAGHGSFCSVWQGVLDAEAGRWQEPMSCAGSDLRFKAISIRFPSLQLQLGKEAPSPWVRHVLPVAFGSSVGHGLRSTPLWIGLQAELHPTRSCPHSWVVGDTGAVQQPPRCLWAFHGSTGFLLPGCCLNIGLQRSLFPG